MGSDINLVVLGGRLTADPEQKATTGGTSLTTFRMANNRWVAGKNGADGREETNFVRVTCWGALADRAAERLQKGAKVLVRGRWQVKQWDDAETGQQREGHELVAEDLDIVTDGRSAPAA